MRGLSSPHSRASPQGPRGFRVALSICTGVLAFSALAAPAVLSAGPSVMPRAMAEKVTQSAPQPAARAPAPRRADFGTHKASPEARHVADWVADSGDNAGAGFVVIDKRMARVYVFDAAARLRGSSPVLLGAARGDDSVPGIGTRPIAEVLPHERTTPAGRFVAERGRNIGGEDVVWVDYDAAVSMHRVRANNPMERRLQRLASPTVADNRISYGCINVPVAFYESTIGPLFADQDAIVYVLPESKPAQQVFGSYAVALPPSTSTERAMRLSRLQ